MRLRNLDTSLKLSKNKRARELDEKKVERARFSPAFKQDMLDATAVTAPPPPNTFLDIEDEDHPSNNAEFKKWWNSSNMNGFRRFPFAHTLDHLPKLLKVDHGDEVRFEGSSMEWGASTSYRLGHSQNKRHTGVLIERCDGL